MGMFCSSLTKGSLLVFGSSGNTSMAAPPRRFSRSAAASAAMSTTLPREALIRIAPGLQAARMRASIILRVRGVAGTCRVTTSACDTASSSDPAARAEPCESRASTS
ncbi:hypothetical protein D3C72_2034340 [compost metagenome]